MNDGSSRWERFPQTDSRSGTKPDEGSQPSSKETTRISITPSQKSGIEMPNNPSSRAPWSAAPRWRTAARMPSGTAITADISSARNAISNVTGRRVSNCSVIGSLVL